MVIIDNDGLQSLRPLPRREPKSCIFEHLYFARPDSQVRGRSAYSARLELGQRTALEHPVDADVVMPIMASGTASAIGYAQGSGTPYQMGLTRLHEVTGTRVGVAKSVLDAGARLWYAPVQDVVSGKRVVVVDELCPSATTMRTIVRMLRESGAEEIHVRITAPPTTGSSEHGNDAPNTDALTVRPMQVDDFREFLGADSLGYLSLEGLFAVEGSDRGHFCEACFPEEYVGEAAAGWGRRQVPLFVRQAMEASMEMASSHTNERDAAIIPRDQD